jgi:hypothetical protein
MLSKSLTPSPIRAGSHLVKWDEFIAFIFAGVVIVL